MRDSEIVKEEGYLGPFEHPNKLKVGQTQSMVFKASDEGPVFWSKAQRDIKVDVVDGVELVGKNIDELRNDLEAKGVDSNRTKDIIKERCIASGIALKKSQPKVIKKGYVGKAKGVFQILDERGWIDRANIHKYTMDGPIDKETEKRLDDYSLSHLIRRCEDFVHEKTCCNTMERD